MTVKELYKKYKEYSIILYGENKTFSLKDCIKNVSPFSFIYTMDSKRINNMEVIDIIVKNESIESTNFSSKLEYIGKTQYKGTVYALVKEIK